MQRLLIFGAFLAALVFGSVPATAQTSITTTTLSGAVTIATPTSINIVVASATGIAVNGILWIDGAVYRVLAVSGTTITVINQYRPSTHLTSATVFVVPLAAQAPINPVGSCIRGTAGQFPAYANYTILFNLADGVMSQCRGTLGSRKWFWTSPYAPVVSDNPPQTP